MLSILPVIFVVILLICIGIIRRKNMDRQSPPAPQYAYHSTAQGTAIVHTGKAKHS